MSFADLSTRTKNLVNVRDKTRQHSLLIFELHFGKISVSMGAFYTMFCKIISLWKKNSKSFIEKLSGKPEYLAKPEWIISHPGM